MPTTLEDTRLWMLALCLASIPLTLASAMLWEAVRPQSPSLHRHRAAAAFRLPAFSRPLLIRAPSVVAVTILTVYLVAPLVSNAL